MINPNSININHAISICNIYNLFFAAAKASLFPFLTLFYRHLGLSAIQVGYLMAAKMLSAFIWASVWSQQAIRLRRRRFYLFLSVTMMLVTNISVWFISASIDTELQTSCKKVVEKSTLEPAITTMELYLNTTSTPWSNDSILLPTTYRTYSTISNNTLNVTATTEKSKFMPTSTRNISSVTNSVTAPNVTRHPVTAPNVTRHPVTAPNVTKHPITTPIVTKHPVTAHIVSKRFVNASAKKILHPTSVASRTTIKPPLLTQPAPMTLKNNSRRHRRSVITANTTSTTPRLSFSALFSNSSWDFHVWWFNFKTWVVNTISKENSRVFLVILLIILIGEPIASAAEKLADDSWYDLLDCIDRLEKYGKHRIWTSMSFFLIPTLVGFLVDNTKCLLPYHMNHILIHCFIFSIFLGLALILTLMLPMPLNTKLVSTSRVKKGVEITCFGCNGFVYMTTVFFMGAAYSTVSNFLFWLIEDLRGHEGVMGLCIMVGTFSEFPILIYGEHFVKFLGTRAVITLSMFFFSVRVFVYTFVLSSWYILPLELLHAFTHTALWYAVFSNPVFNVSPEIDRSIRNILSSAYFGIGFSVGSVVSGYIVEYWNMAMLFRSAAVFCFVWSIIFFFIDKYMPRQSPVKYQRLLQAEEDNSDDSTAAVESDWLEQALKES